jgi:hypothetical protein
MTMHLRHPGTIELIDAVTGKLLECRSATELGDSAWATDTEGNKVPIVRVLLSEHGDRRELHAFGPQGQFLKTTLQLAQECD